ncbi:hypothetical protein [Duganella callida]|uniref:Uncharacterized protein n=1 Tax=Duganella callida TaxID=2561932 RepID=A0A4Y9S7F4_9BURK|nr:hypothetical protein [Duganella callida]TFW15458.1 hypothetical protein E4L98_26630 [Duganella callida]
MNTQAAFKTLLVYLAVGAVVFYGEWRTGISVTPAQRAKADIAQCIKEREQAAYATSMFTMGREAKAQKAGIQTECENLVRGGGLVLGTSPAPATTQATTPKPAAHKATKQAQQVTAAAEKPASASNRRELCLTRIEEARQRSPGGLNPEWEQDQRNRCDAL